MKEFWKNLKNWQKWGIIGGVLTVIIIVAVAVLVILNSEPNVKINFDQNVSIPGGEIKKIRQKLAKVISNNTENFSSKIEYVGNARDYQESLGSENNMASFIVNFDAISESYAVEITWPVIDENIPNINISCALLNGKYPETPCETEINSSKDIFGYLPYTGKLDSGEEYNIVVGYDNGKMYLSIQVNSCGDTTILNEALLAARKWISSINFNPDDYLLYVPGDICDTELILDTFPYIQANHVKTNDKNVNQFLPYFIPEAYNVYPVVDEKNNVTSIRARVPGCFEYQMEPGKTFVKEYLNSKGINYQITFEEC